MEQELGNRKDLKIEKAAAVEKTEESLETGEFEAYQYVGGVSDVWEEFFKIRKADTKEHVDFVQCIECKILLSFKEHSGTSHLSRHKCRKSKTDGVGQFRRLPVDKIESTKSLITNNTIKLCTQDFLSFDTICNSANLLNWAQSFVTLGYKHGNIRLQEVFPNRTRIDREINNLKDENMRSIYDNYREALTNNWCSATMEVRSYGNKKVIVMSIQYFEKDLKGLKKKVFLSIILEEDDTPDDFLLKFLKQFNICGGDKKDLKNLTVVTPNEDIFLKSLVSPITRNDCAAEKITQLLNAGFETNGADNIISEGREAVKFLNLSEKLDVFLKEDDGSWQGKVEMIRSIYENYDAITDALEKEKKNQLQFNKRKAEEVLLFLEPFAEALDDLSASAYPTANKILLWWKVLSDHLKKEQFCSWELKRIIAAMSDNFDEKFYPSADNKIACFLDPRYKSLKMLKENERESVIADVRTLLEQIEDDRGEEAAAKSVPVPKRSRFASFEVEKPKKEKLRKKNRFESYECTTTDPEDNDEVSIYLKLPPIKIENDFDIIEKFWKLKKRLLPKLFKLASSRLHVPACCGISGLQMLTANDNLKECDLSNYIFVRDNI